MAEERKSFADYKPDRNLWITLAPGQYYPDYLADVTVLFEPVLTTFAQLVQTSSSPTHLYLQIAATRNPMRTQLFRVFRRYACPELPVELTKKVTQAQQICTDWGHKFRLIHDVQAALQTRPIRDETLSALLAEHMERGKSGYSLTDQFFTEFRKRFPDLPLSGPTGAGRDIPLGTVPFKASVSLPAYPNPRRPVDFIIHDLARTQILAVGFARYDGDRGGAQEDDRIGGYRNCADEILGYTQNNGLSTKVIFLNEGPGLLTGSMWDDYADLERRWPGKIIVLTLRMLPERLTREWLLG